MKYKPAIRLFSKKNDLNIISFFLLLFSDIFICILLFYGLSQQIDQFTSEYEYFPHEYRNMLIQKNWVENNIHEKITSHVLNNTRSTYEKENVEDRLHPKCQEIEVLFTDIENDTSLIKDLELYDRLLKNYNNLDREERTASEGQDLYEQIQNGKNDLNGNQKIENLMNKIFSNQNDDYANDLIHFRKIFALKRTVFDFIFLLPVLAAFIYWNRQSYFKERYLSLIISSHYIIIAFLPILFETIRLIIEVIPEIFLKTIYDFLLKMNLITFWYYALLLISIALIVLIIWFFQTKIFTKEKYKIKQYENSKCMSCNTKINYRNKNCPVCGIPLYKKCRNCGEDTINNLPFCMNCGTNIRSKT